MTMKKIDVALVGLGFGSCFVPIWLDHPNVGTVTVCEKNEKLLLEMKERYPQIRITTSFEEVLRDETIDAVHLVTPIPLHADQTVAVLDSGKHCACTVPMATSLEDIRRIVEARRRSGKNYMMMETTLYTYQFFYVRELLEKGVLGKIQFLRGSHYQDMVGWPPYWMGLPPMWYGTHAIGPMVVLSGSRIKRTVAFGSGTMDPSLHEQYGNPYPVETALFDFGNGLKGEATRSLFETTRAYQEGLFVYGSRGSFEWDIEDGGDPYVTVNCPPEPGLRGSWPKVEKVSMPNYYHSLPEPIRKYTVDHLSFDPQNPQASLEEGSGGGHHGSHPHLVHEFVMS
ncbi:MAG: Gfo/Idh/MocA family oxidoreductase, partial [Clostridia bacterium]|nr:Gfo/Idh/MocA family oxidoreductase [Clostridia bacterium]